MGNIMQQRRDFKVNWESKNPILADGQIAYETDTKPFKMKVGDGVTNWNQLDYFSSGSSETYVHPATHPASMITETADRIWFTPAEKTKLDNISPIITTSTLKTIFTINGIYTPKKSGRYRIVAVGGGGGGSSCLGCGGGSGQSMDRIFNLEITDSITITIGNAGSGNVNYTPSPVNNLPSSGDYSGRDGGNTIISIKKILGGATETINLTGGKGAISSAPSSIQYAAGTGEDNGGVMSMNMFASPPGNTNWNGGDGGSSYFGSGGKGGTVTYGDFQKLNAGDGISFGSGGGGGGFRMMPASSSYYWTSGGDGQQGVVIIEELST